MREVILKLGKQFIDIGRQCKRETPNYPQIPFHVGSPAFIRLRHGRPIQPRRTRGLIRASPSGLPPDTSRRHRRSERVAAVTSPSQSADLAGSGRAGRGFTIGLGIAQICSWGSLYYSFPLVAQAMGRDLGWDKGTLYLAATLGLAFTGLLTYPVGAAIDRGYGRAIMAGGSFAAGLLLILWSRADSLPMFYLALAGLGAVQAATLYDPVFAVVARRLGPAQARPGITAITLWGGFASTIFIPLIQLLIDQTGWRTTLVVLGLINIGLCAVLNFCAIDPSLDAPAPHPIGGAERTRPPRSAVAQAVKNPVFWMLALAFTAYSGMFTGLTFHLYPLLVERGFDVGTVVTAIAIIGPSQVAGRVAIWVLAPRMQMRALGSTIIAVFPPSLLMLEFAPPHFLVLAVFGVAFGAANGILTIVRGLAVPEMLTRRAYGAVNGALAVPSIFARALAPAGLAALWSVSGSYDAVLAAIVVLSLMLCGGFWTAAILSRRRDAP